METSPVLRGLLKAAERDDTWEESAEDFLVDHHIPYATSSRVALLTLAWQSGWRPF